MNAWLCAAVSGPYEVDANTLHLYHFDGNAYDAVVTNPIHLTLSGATVNGAAYTDFGTSLNTYAGGDTAIAYSDEKAVSNFTGGNGAFTFEAIVKLNVPIGSIPNHMEIISGDDEDTGRGWQFRINTSGEMEFNNISVGGNQFSAALPAYTVGGWYHAAVTYNGQAGSAGNVKFYWTSLDEQPDEAALLASFQMSADIANYAIDFAVGNEARSASSENFEGWIDEARISSVARAADGMMFAAGPYSRPVIVTHPADVIASQGQTASFVTVFESVSAPVVQWFKVDSAGDVELTGGEPGIVITTTYEAGTGQYTTTLQIADVQMADRGAYYCKVNNESNLPRLSDLAELTVVGLVAHWTFDATDFAAGRYLDVAGGYDAAAAGTPVFAAGANGQANKAVRITPQGGWATVDGFDPGATGQLTASVWVRWDDTPGTTDDLAVTTASGGLLVEPGGLAADLRWRHLCMTFDGTMGRLYINGVLRQEGLCSLPADMSSLLEIGAADGTEAFNGCLDDLRIYNYALTADEVAAVYAEMTNGCALPYASYFDLGGPAQTADCVVDIYDLAVLAGDWLVQYDLAAFEDFAGNWLSSGLAP